jgi:hypothetical protein
MSHSLSLLLVFKIMILSNPEEVKRLWLPKREKGGESFVGDVRGRRGKQVCELPFSRQMALFDSE